MKVAFCINNKVYVKVFTDNQQLADYLDGLLVGMIQSGNAPSVVTIHFEFLPQVKDKS